MNQPLQDLRDQLVGYRVDYLGRTDARWEHPAQSLSEGFLIMPHWSPQIIDSKAWAARR